MTDQPSPDFPFHVTAGPGGDAPSAPGARPTDAANGPAREADGFARVSSSRRRKLWELPTKFHCPIVGVCFDCNELRGLIAKLMYFPRDTSDFVLHTTAVTHCGDRSDFAERLQKTLEQRYRLTIRQLAALKTPAEVSAAWQQACRDGAGIPASLWAAWTHPACDSALEQEIYADIHMLQHQVGSGTRADLAALQTLIAERGRLRREVDDARRDADALRRDKAEATRRLASQATELRQALIARDAAATNDGRKLEALRTRLADLPERQTLQQRLTAAHEQIAELKSRHEAQAGELVRLREFARYAEETFEALAREDEALADLPARDLTGKCVLCVGGRSGAVRTYRDVVEQHGGRFLHHDGGLEESLHRIDAALAAADIVICQTGCISHNAYWRVKDLCKRTGKACMFVKNSSVSSFVRVVGAAGRTTGEGDEG